jgi:hypothetical protein
MRFLTQFGVRGQSPGGCSNPVQHKMKNFGQAKLNEEIRSYTWQPASVVDSEMSMSPVLVSPARCRKSDGL